ncbi:AfsR/SARP family transcriptional regulator [Actinomadura macrotermitis]|uniref:OmpR/PhoB-type domain-containing protein n=1 Tax=Actinomadura macrotermitis TaxID=2585200 RepID=A0A7K0BZ48_9ACTN|nr:AfsR/SARP family transcriptional regulator [Actinomadura macrotermitis]MQY06447.1 hypothetical protein [Actinomadura macrotermitis]
MRYRILGELVVEGTAGPVRIASARQRIVLSVLLLEAGRVVPVERLAAAVWDDDPPPSARSQIQICISALRRTLAGAGIGDAIRTRPPGYLIEVPGEELDLRVFDRLAAEGRGAEAEGRVADAADCYRRALELWRGEPFGGLDRAALNNAAVALTERRLGLVEQSMDVRLRLGEHHELIGELTALAAAHPLRERLRAQLMTALSRDGRSAEALAVYREGREQLVEELGLEPAPALRRLEQSILSGDPGFQPAELVPADITADVSTDISTGVTADRTGEAGAPGEISPAAAPPPGDAGDALPEAVLPVPRPAAEVAAPFVVPRPVVPAVPRFLPADIADFTGREELAAELGRRLEPDPAAPVPVVAISGQGGVGKTTLAVHVAHQVAARFPGGQLYTTLSGASQRPLAPVAALERLLRALGVTDPEIPPTLEERAELYRARLAGRRVLVVLDDAADEEQILPLLPGSGGSALLVTARRRLTSLPGAYRVDLGVFDVASGLALVRGIIGAARADAEPDAARALVRHCGGLPLALRIAAARAAAKPHWPLSRLVSRLADGERRRLDELAHGGLGIRSNIEVTYAGLGPGARRLFRRLALVPGGDFDAWVGEPLLEHGAVRAEDVLEELVDVRLVEVARGAVGVPRYRLHELVRAYAAERLAEEEPEPDRAAARRRLLGALLHLAEEARRRGPGGLVPLAGPSPRHPLPAPLVDALLADPLAWYERERPTLIEAVALAARAEPDGLGWELATGLAALFEVGKHHADWHATHEGALAAVRAAGERRGEAALLHSLGALALLEGRGADAAARWERAAEILADLGDAPGHALLRTLLKDLP